MVVKFTSICIVSPDDGIPAFAMLIYSASTMKLEIFLYAIIIETKNIFFSSNSFCVADDISTDTTLNSSNAHSSDFEYSFVHFHLPFLLHLSNNIVGQYRKISIINFSISFSSLSAMSCNRIYLT